MIRFLMMLVFVFCTGLAFAQPEVLAPVFNQQLQQSCSSSASYLKTVKDLTDAQATPETLEAQFPVDSVNCSLGKDMFYAIEFFAWAPKQLEFFTQSKQGDTLISVVKPNNADDLELQTQKMVYADGKIIYLESILNKDYWLYTNKVRIQVYFSPEGQYQSHTLLIRTEVVWGGDMLNSLVQGKATY